MFPCMIAFIAKPANIGYARKSPFSANTKVKVKIELFVMLGRYAF